MGKLSFIIRLFHKWFQPVFAVWLWLNVVGTILFAFYMGWSVSQWHGFALGFAAMLGTLAVGFCLDVMMGGFYAVILNIERHLEKLASSSTMTAFPGATAQFPVKQPAPRMPIGNRNLKNGIVEMDTDKIPETDVIFSCPQCQKQFSVDRCAAGMEFKCTDCGTPMTIPRPVAKRGL